MARTYLNRLGFDNVVAHLCNGMPDWRNRGKPIARLKTCSVEQLKNVVDRAAVIVLDVRDDHEWRDGHIKGAQHLFVGYLQQQVARVPRDTPLAVHCSWGGRASLAVSILARNGYASATTFSARSGLGKAEDIRSKEASIATAPAGLLISPRRRGAARFPASKTKRDALCAKE